MRALTHKESTELYFFGINEDLTSEIIIPQLKKESLFFKICELKHPIKTISCGFDFFCFLTYKGLLFSMGSNYEGRLGIGDQFSFNINEPQLIKKSLNTPFINVVCGWEHSLALTENGQLYSWGDGKNGKLGNGGVSSRWEPTIIDSPDLIGSNIIEISCGFQHTLVLNDNGEVFSFGNGENGELGISKNSKEYYPIKIKDFTGIVQICAAINFSLFLNKEGEIYSAGLNNKGQLGLSNKINQNIPTKINFPSIVKFIKISCSQFSVSLTSLGEIYVWGPICNEEYINPIKFSNSNLSFVEIIVAGNSGLTLDCNNCLWSWGKNDKGQLGLGDNINRNELTFVQNFNEKNKNIYKFCSNAFNFIFIVGEIKNKIEKNQNKIQNKITLTNKVENIIDIKKNMGKEIMKLKEECFNFENKSENLNNELIKEKNDSNILKINLSKQIELNNSLVIENKDLNLKLNDLKKMNQLIINEKIDLQTNIQEKNGYITNLKKNVSELQIEIQHHKNEANEFYFNLIKTKDTKKLDQHNLIQEIYNLKTKIQDLNQINQAFISEKNQLEEKNEKFIKSFQLINEEKLILENNLKFLKEKNEKNENLIKLEKNTNFKFKKTCDQEIINLNEKEEKYKSELELMNFELKKLSEKNSNLQNENYDLNKKIQQLNEYEFYFIKYNDLERQNNIFLMRLQERNNEFNNILEKCTLLESENKRLFNENIDLKRNKLWKEKNENEIKKTEISLLNSLSISSVLKESNKFQYTEESFPLDQSIKEKSNFKDVKHQLKHLMINSSEIGEKLKKIENKINLF